MADKILVFIPMYNCAAQIPRVVAQFDNAVMANASKLLLVDNGSRDDTMAAAQQALQSFDRSRYCIVRNRENYSLGGSHKVAFEYALKFGYSHVIVFHGDDQGRITDMLAAVKTGTHNQSDCLLGARFMKGSSLKGYSSFRIVANCIFNLLFTLATGRMIYDLGAGLNMYSVPILRDRAYLKFADNLNFNHYMLLHSIASGQKIRFIPISWCMADQVTNASLIQFGVQTIKILLSYVFARQTLLKNDHSMHKKGVYQYDVIAGEEG